LKSVINFIRHKKLTSYGINFVLCCTKVILYNGQLDIIVAPPLTENFIESIKWSKASQYKSADRLVWKVSDKDTEVAGYVRVVHNFYQVIVRNGGHVIAFDQPRATLDMITRFVKNQPFKNQ